MADESIKWRRQSLRISNAAMHQERMALQLYKEAFDEVKPGQLVRLTSDQSEIVIHLSAGLLSQQSIVASPLIPKGEILMYVRWADNETAGNVGDPWLRKVYTSEHTKVNGPLWLFREKLHFRRIELDDLELIQTGEKVDGRD